MDETKYGVLLDEFRATTAAMQFKPCPQIIGDADVERSVPAAGEDVDVYMPAALMIWHDLVRTLTPVAMGPGLRRDDGNRNWNKLRTF
jgi:hypothetical protein